LTKLPFYLVDRIARRYFANRDGLDCMLEIRGINVGTSGAMGKRPPVGV